MPKGASAVLDGIRVLVVEDEPDALFLISAVLEMAGASVTAVSSANEALEAMRRARPDVLVSDIGMPGEDGYALIRKVRAMGRARGGGVPAAALTAFARDNDRDRALREGFQVHVAKPVDPTVLVELIAELATRPAAA